MLGTKLIFTGVLEDSTFKVSFVSHRISYPLIRNSVYKFNSGYVHEFDDKSVLLVVTEHTKIEPKNVEDYRVCVEEGLASGLINTSRQIGGPIGLALLSHQTGQVVQLAMAMVTGFGYALLGAALLTGMGIIFTALLKQQRYHQVKADSAS